MSFGRGDAPGAVLFSTDLFPTDNDAVKSVDKTEAQLGDVLTYEMTETTTQWRGALGAVRELIA